ncbi:MAG: hypothetical protein BMS9Abin10_0035 [Gammaproteobacteria bacterium]|nr:MAG: hypothetical protein BMS9Abin10_0035 [Gammaproteobacteria bacterium]
MNVLSRILFGSVLLLLGACSSGEPPEDYVWKTQTEALEKARGVEQMLQDAAQEKRRAMERETQ